MASDVTQIDPESRSEEQYVTPPVNICETDDAVIVEAEMPGVDKEHLEVLVEGDELVIIGRRPASGEAQNVAWQEIPPCDYRRVFALGDHVDRNRIQAAFESGILTLRIGKADEVKPHRIQIQI